MGGGEWKQRKPHLPKSLLQHSLWRSRSGWLGREEGAGGQPHLLLLTLLQCPQRRFVEP